MLVFLYSCFSLELLISLIPSPECSYFISCSPFSSRFSQPVSSPSQVPQAFLGPLTPPSSPRTVFPLPRICLPATKQNNTGSGTGTRTRERAVGKKTLLIKKEASVLKISVGRCLLNHLLLQMWNFQQYGFHFGGGGLEVRSWAG